MQFDYCELLQPLSVSNAIAPVALSKQDFALGLVFECVSVSLMVVRRVTSVVTLVTFSPNIGEVVGTMNDTFGLL